jgi:hypothetical protein
MAPPTPLTHSKRPEESSEVLRIHELIGVDALQGRDGTERNSTDETEENGRPYAAAEEQECNGHYADDVCGCQGSPRSKMSQSYSERKAAAQLG